MQEELKKSDSDIVQTAAGQLMVSDISDYKKKLIGVIERLRRELREE